MIETPWLAPERPDLVWFSGSDASRFLNDLLSQEIADMQPGSVARSLLLGPQGKLDHLLWVLRDADRIGLVTDAGRGGELASTLGRYRIRVDVDIQVSDEPAWLVVGEMGLEPSTWRHEDESLIADLSWFGVSRVMIAGPRPDLVEGSWEQYEALRITSGEPRWGRDVDEGTIPQETDLVGVAVSLDKGCFLGQELVARIDSRGRVNRHLRILEFQSEPPTVGSEILFGDRKVGILTSVAEGKALALVRREVAPGDRVTVEGVDAVVHETPRSSQRQFTRF